MFYADARYFNGFKLVIGATNNFKVVDYCETQSSWDEYYKFEIFNGDLRITNNKDFSIRLRFYDFL